METIDKAWHTAADTLKSELNSSHWSQKPWTEYGKEEPLSGIQGKGTPTDPYDAGNRDEQPGAPNGQQNTALVPEALVSTGDDTTSGLKKSSQTPATNGTRRESGNKFMGVMPTPEQRTQPPPPSLTTPTTGRASVMDGLYGRDSTAAPGGSRLNGVEEEGKPAGSAAAQRPSQAPQYPQKSQNPITTTKNFTQTQSKIEQDQDANAQVPPAKVANLNDQSATVPPTTNSMDEDTRRLSLQKDKYTGAEMSKRQSLMGSQAQGAAAAAAAAAATGGTDGTADEGSDYMTHDASQSHAAGLSISGTPGVPERPAPPMSKVSEEALKGPQCSAKPPYDFEKQLDDPTGRRKSKSSHKKSESTGDANTTNTTKSAEKTPSSEESSKSGSKNSRHSGGTLHHMKEKLEKVVHRGNHSK